MNYDLYSQAGKKTGSVTLNESVFAASVSNRLLAQYVHVFRSNQRASVADTKDRGEVSGGGRKPWAQKGTGNARAGSSRSPIWRKGGVTFGPLSDRNWKKDMNKKMRQAAIRGALTTHVKAGSLRVIDALSLGEKELTKQAQKFVADQAFKGSVIVILPEYDKMVVKAFANLPKVRTVLVSELNAFDVISTANVVVVQPALEYIESHWSK